ncbi:TPA: PspC domain-containing protein [Candidatus Woesearchaeota archaeon]|nr:PspC domain-containing protein [Candidatus Woesearchaeota archaeon]HIH12271.1 PspC domain-containing protein [Candidatus Woesearchaeota archaeon]
MPKPIKRLYRSEKDKVLGGVCAGIADYFEIDLVIVRVLWVILTLFSMGAGLLAYLIAWAIIPLQPKHPKP